MGPAIASTALVGAEIRFAGLDYSGALVGGTCAGEPLSGRYNAVFGLEPDGKQVMAWVVKFVDGVATAPALMIPSQYLDRGRFTWWIHGTWGRDGTGNSREVWIGERRELAMAGDPEATQRALQAAREASKRAEAQKAAARREAIATAAGLVVAAGSALGVDAPSTGPCTGAYTITDTDRSMFGESTEIRYTIQCSCDGRFHSIRCGDQHNASVPRSRCGVPDFLAPQPPAGVTDLGAVSSSLCGGRP